jgi:outer membrane lipopolysaccharide assembly protein LptE/RlpB
LIPFIGNGVCQRLTRLLALDVHLALGAIDLHLRGRVELQDSSFDGHFAMTTGHALNLELLLHENTSLAMIGWWRRRLQQGHVATAHDTRQKEWYRYSLALYV